MAGPAIAEYEHTHLFHGDIRILLFSEYSEGMEYNKFFIFENNWDVGTWKGRRRQSFIQWILNTCSILTPLKITVLKHIPEISYTGKCKLQ